MREEKLKKYWYSILLGLIFLLGGLLRLKGLLINPSLWHDECALGWNIRFKSYSDFFGILHFEQMAPPFFMILTKLMTKILGFSDMVLRIVPFLAGIGSLMAFYFLASKVLKSESITLWATFFFAINQPLISYSFEFKPYDLDVFFTIICLLFFINLNIEKLSIKKTIFYAFVLAIIPWFSLVSIFILAGGFLNLFCKDVKFNLMKKTILAFPLIISGLVYLKIYLINNYINTGTTFMVNYWQYSFITKNPLYFFRLFVASVKYFFFPIQHVLFALILFVWGLVIYLEEKISFINISIISFILLIFASYLHLYPFAHRLILFLIPIFLLLIIKPLDSAIFDKKIKLVIAIFLTFLTFYPQIIWVNDFIHAKNISKGEYPREMMKFMAKNLKKNDIIFVNNLSDAEFAYYASFYNVKNKVIQELPSNNGIELLNSIKVKDVNFCWVFLAYGDLQPFLNWVKAKEIIYNYKYHQCALMYVYVK